MDNIYESVHLVNQDAEMYVIGAILKDSRRILKLCRHFNIKSECFTLPLTACTWTAAQMLDEAGQIVEPASVADIIKTKGLSSGVSMMDLHHCESVCKSPKNTMQYIQLVLDRYKKRQLALHLMDLQATIDSDEPVANIIANTQQVLTQLGRNQESKDTIKDIAAKVSEKFLNAKTQGCAGIPSRWLSLQNITGGYNRGETCIISGLPKEGKTTLALNELYDKGKAGTRVGIISMEMSEEKLRTKMACDELGFDGFRLKMGEATNSEIYLVKEEIEKQSELPITIIDKSKDINEIAGIMRDYQDDWEMVAIDYIQKIRPCKSDPNGTVERISNWSNTITNTTGDTGMATLLLSQMSREAATDHKGKRREPEARFLKGSGALEQDLSQLVFVYQDLRYGNDIIPDNVDTKFKVAMNRDGKVGKIDMVFQKSKQRFVIKGTEFADKIDADGPAF